MQWHKHPSRQSHQRRDIFPVIHDPASAVTQEPETSTPCSVCGDGQARQHCQQCNADYCEACGKKMHLHPKRKNHTLQLLPGRTTIVPQDPTPMPQVLPPPQLPSAPLNEAASPKRQPPDGLSIRGSIAEEPVPLSHLPIRRPENFSNQGLDNQQMGQMPQGFSNQQMGLRKSAQGFFYQQVGASQAPQVAAPSDHQQMRQSYTTHQQQLSQHRQVYQPAPVNRQPSPVGQSVGVQQQQTSR